MARFDAKVENILNRLLRIHGRSLSVYLADASPWSTHQEAHAQDVLDMISADQVLTVERLADEIIAKGGIVRQGNFPTEFAGIHDCSIGYVISELAKFQARDVIEIEELVGMLDADGSARPLAEEALGAAKGHLESLNELLQSVSA